tara:strand:- start:648 stop:1085 length:438 start_codon:yes stop_codon:yes gene_type:complete
VFLISFIDIYFNIMNIKSSKELVDNANETIITMSPEQVKSAYDKGEITLIDVRDIRELWKEGTIKESIHIPRGMLEFWLDPQSSYYQEKKIGEMKNIVLFCALGFRSALATKTLKEMGFDNVANAQGGFDSLKKIGLPIISKEKK